MIKYLFFIILILCILKYYQSNMNNIGIISLIIVLGLYIIDLIMKDNIEKFTETSSPIQTQVISQTRTNYNIIYTPTTSVYNIIFSDETIINIINNYTNVINLSISPNTYTLTDYNTLAIYNSKNQYSYYFICSPISQNQNIKFTVHNINNYNDDCNLISLYIYKKYLIDNYIKGILESVMKRITNPQNTPTIINTVVNIKYTLVNAPVQNVASELQNETNNIIGYIRIKQGDVIRGVDNKNMISFNTGLYYINNTQRYSNDYYKLLNLVNENDENIANHILSILVDPGPSDIITLEIPSSYYVYAYYGTGNNICFKSLRYADRNQDKVRIHYMVNNEILSNILLSRNNYSMIYSNTANIIPLIDASMRNTLDQNEITEITI